MTQFYDFETGFGPFHLLILIGFLKNLKKKINYFFLNMWSIIYQSVMDLG